MSAHRPILLVEDNLNDAALMIRAFGKARILNEVVVAEDGQQAMDYLRGEGAYTGRDVSESPALVLLDLNLPILPGMEVLRQIRADLRLCRTPVVILTSSQEELDLGAGYDLGVNSYICKPVKFEQLQTVVESLGFYWLLLNSPPPPK